MCSMWLWKTNPKERLKYPSPFETPSWARISEWRGSFGGGMGLTRSQSNSYVSGRGDVNSMWLAWLQTINSSWSPMCSYHHSITCSRASINLSQFLSYLNNWTIEQLHWSCLIWKHFLLAASPQQGITRIHPSPKFLGELPRHCWMSTAKMRRFLSFTLRSPHFSPVNTLPKKRLQGRKFSAQCNERWTAVFWGAIWPTSCWRERNLLENSWGVSGVSSITKSAYILPKFTVDTKKMGAVEIMYVVCCLWIQFLKYYQYHQTFQVPKMEVLTYISCM